uniref:Secreted protein n=1 Tax=Heterorhabditis bacteriophora TaxID=37862 RepID=A0A1I7WZH2_HETBA
MCDDDVAALVECVKQGLLEMMLLVLFFLQLLDVPVTKESWLVWVKRTHTSEMKHNQREARIALILRVVLSELNMYTHANS